MDPAPANSSPALTRALELREEGKSLRVIAGILEAEAVPKPGRVKNWSAKAVSRLFAPPASPSTTPGPTPAPVEIPGAADAVLTRLAGQIAELEELNEEREALDREARQQLAEARAWAAEEAERRAQEHERAEQQQGQQIQQIVELGRFTKEIKQVWGTRWKRWFDAKWRTLIIPLLVGGVLGGAALGWVWWDYETGPRTKNRRAVEAALKVLTQEQVDQINEWVRAANADQ